MVGHRLDTCPRCGEALETVSRPADGRPERAECEGSPKHSFEVVNEGTAERPRYRLGAMIDPDE